MTEVICDTSPIQYLHQLDILSILNSLAKHVTVPLAVITELEEGRRLGIDLPDLASMEWFTVTRPISRSAVPLVVDLGPGETEVLMLALETRKPVVILDDALARRVAETLKIPHTGTLGLLISAKTAGLITAVGPYLDQLDRLHFHLATQTRTAVLKLAGEQ